MEDTRIKEVEKELKKLGCGKVEIGPDFTIKRIEGDLFNKEKIIYHEEETSTNFIAIAKSPYGSVVLGKDESLDFMKATLNLMRIVFSTPTNKVLKRGLYWTFRKIVRKKLK